MATTVYGQATANQLGLIVVDSCGIDLLALSTLYRLFSNTNLKLDNIVSIMLFNTPDRIPYTLKFVSKLEVPKLFLVPLPVMDDKKVNRLGFVGIVDAARNAIDALIATIDRLQLHNLFILYSDTWEMENALVHFNTSSKVCNQTMLKVDSEPEQYDHAENMRLTLRKLLLYESRGVVLLLTKHHLRLFFEAIVKETVTANRFILLSQYSVAIEDLPSNFNQPLIFIKALTRNVTMNERLLTEKVFEIDSLFPTKWYKEAVALTNECHFDDDSERIKSAASFSRRCDRKNAVVKLTSSDYKTVDYLSINIAARLVEKAVQTVVMKHCPGMPIHTMRDCLAEPGDALKVAFRNITLRIDRNIQVKFGDPSIRRIPFSIELLRNGTGVQLGVAFASGIQWDISKLFHLQVKPSQCSRLQNGHSNKPVLPIFAKLQTVTSIATAALFAFGVAACVLCAICNLFSPHLDFFSAALNGYVLLGDENFHFSLTNFFVLHYFALSLI